MFSRFCATAALAAIPCAFISPTLAQDITAGRDVYLSKCISCHKFKCVSNGPPLEGVVGRQVGSHEDYGFFTQGLLDAKFVWTVEKLDEFLAAPGEMFPESTMSWATSVEDGDDRQNLIAYLQTDDPTVDLCPK